MSEQGADDPRRAAIYLPVDLASDLAAEGLVVVADDRPVSTWAIGGPVVDGAIVVVGGIASVVTLVESTTLRQLAERLVSWVHTRPTPEPASNQDHFRLSIQGRRGLVRVELVGEETADSLLDAIDAAFGRREGEALSGNDESYKLAFDEARRAIDVQLDKLDSIHSRMGQLFSAAAVSGGLLAGISLAGHRADRITIVGTVAFIVAGAAFAFVCGALVYVWNFTHGNFALNPDTIIFDYIEARPPKSTAQIYRDLARWMNVHRANNGVKIDERRDAFQRATIAFGIELVALGVALWDVVR